jgi:gas vesicle protein
MGKILVGVAVGVFVGAMIAEIIQKTNPKWLQKLKAKITENAKAAKQTFMEGYMGTETA